MCGGRGGGGGEEGGGEGREVGREGRGGMRSVWVFIVAQLLFHLLPSSSTSPCLLLHFF